MLDILYLLTQTEPIRILTPTVAQAYYEPVEEPMFVDPIANNCYLYVSQYVKLPLTQRIVPNTVPYIGAVAIFQYKLKHYALVDKLTEDGFWVKESNYTEGVIGKRFIKWNDPKLVGFYSAPAVETGET